MKTLRLISLTALSTLALAGCKGDAKTTPDGPGTGGGTTPPTEYTGRSYIEWIESSKKRVFEGNYARMIELSDKSFFLVSGSGNGTQYAVSTDRGKTWSAPKIIAESTADLKMAVPEVMQCSDGSLLISYNPRPAVTGGSFGYGIRAKKGTKVGNDWVWGEEKILYTAGNTEREGCWEPATLQLPTGEIQLYFSNEKDINGQNINILRSHDNGETWTATPEVISYRSNTRDGMPAPLYLPESQEILVAIEDNGWPGYENRFRPTIVRTTIEDNWESGPVGGGSNKRNFTLVGQLPSTDNGAAPYLRLLPTGEVLLSYQGNENRAVPQSGGKKTTDYSQEMFVAVGDKTGRNFTHKTTPFNLPIGPGGVWPADGVGYQGMWNSLMVDSEGYVWAVSSVNNYDYPKSTIMIIKGMIIQSNDD